MKTFAKPLDPVQCSCGAHLETFEQINGSRTSRDIVPLPCSTSINFELIHNKGNKGKDSGLTTCIHIWADRNNTRGIILFATSSFMTVCLNFCFPFFAKQCDGLVWPSLTIRTSLSCGFFFKITDRFFKSALYLKVQIMYSI